MLCCLAISIHTKWCKIHAVYWRLLDLPWKIGVCSWFKDNRKLVNSYVYISSNPDGIWVTRGWHSNISCTLIGSANRKIDIFKITCKVLLCVEVGLIKKTLSWNQILCIPYSVNLKLLYQTSCISARWSASFADHHIWHTDTWLRGEHSGKCLQYILQFCRAPGHKLLNHRRSAKNDAISNAKIHKKLLIYLRVTEDMSTKLRKEHWSAIDKAVDCHSRK